MRCYNPETEREEETRWRWKDRMKMELLIEKRGREDETCRRSSPDPASVIPPTFLSPSRPFIPRSIIIIITITDYYYYLLPSISSLLSSLLIF